MKYTYVEFGDGTLVTFNDIKIDQNGEHIHVYFEKPVAGDFHYLETTLPDLNIVGSNGFTDDESKKLLNFTRNNASLIWELARKYGVDPIADAI